MAAEAAAESPAAGTAAEYYIGESCNSKFVVDIRHNGLHLERTEAAVSFEDFTKGAAQLAAQLGFVGWAFAGTSRPTNACGTPASVLPACDADVEFHDFCVWQPRGGGMRSHDDAESNSGVQMRHSDTSSEEESLELDQNMEMMEALNAPEPVQSNHPAPDQGLVAMEQGLNEVQTGSQSPVANVSAMAFSAARRQQSRGAAVAEKVPSRSTRPPEPATKACAGCRGTGRRLGRLCHCCSGSGTERCAAQSWAPDAEVVVPQTANLQSTRRKMIPQGARLCQSWSLRSLAVAALGRCYQRQWHW